MGKMLGVDFGDRRTGVAVSDADGVIAFPRETLDCPLIEQAAAAVARLADAVGGAASGGGRPLNMVGARGRRPYRTRGFCAVGARRTAIPVKPWDERLSTRLAESVLIEAGTRREKRRGVVDKLAAQIILQSYLDAAGGAAAHGYSEEPP
jgi:putative Holliday junction resolvase